MAKSPKRKPSFESPADEAAAPDVAWVYRSDGPPADARTEAPVDGASGTRPRTRKMSRSAKRPLGEAPRGDQPQAAEPPDRVDAAHRIVDRYARYSAAAGLLPIPVIDVAAITGVQVAMLHALSAHYDVPYSRDNSKALVTTLLGGLMPSLAGHQVLKLVGPLVGMISVSGFALAATYAVGRLFIAHFEAGGTLLDVDIEQSRRDLAATVSRR